MDGTSDPAKALLSLKDVDRNTFQTPCWRDNTSKPINAGSSNSFPSEVLSSIFLFAIPPYTLLETPLYDGENSTWNQALRFKKSIILVCRTWYDVGIILLYKNICIRRCQELDSLRQTLLGSAKNLGPLVQSLSIQCFIPEDHSDFGATLETVIGCCTSLSNFSFNTPFIPPLRTIQKITLPAHITHFRLEGHFEYALVLRLLSQLEGTLLSLRIMIQDNDFNRSTSIKVLRSQFRCTDFRSQSLCLSSLRSLTVSPLKDLGILMNQWTMPSLQKLTVAGEGIFPYNYWDNQDYSVVQSAIESFLSANGHQLQQLHIAFIIRFEPDLFKKVLEHCPQLERLIMDPSTFLLQHWTDSDDLFHPHLRYVDLIYHRSVVDKYRPSELCLSKKNLPSLECIRRFCNLPSWAHTWLDDYPPNPEAEGEIFKIEVFQNQINFQEGSYVWVEQKEEEEDCVNEEEIDADSDSDYIFTTSDEDPGSSEEDGFSEEDDFSEEGDSSEEPINTGSNNSFPPEVLLSIFLSAIPPYTLLETPLYDGENSTWNQALRFKKSIVLVCRTWYDAGIILLYKNICIRRCQELDSLRQTLLGSAKNLGPLVKSLAIQCCIPKDHSDFNTTLELVIVCCTSLWNFSFNTPFIPPRRTMLGIQFPTRITHFRLEGHFEYALVLGILSQLKDTLLSLHIMIQDKDGDFEGSMSMKVCRSQLRCSEYQKHGLCLSSLQSLTVSPVPDFGILLDEWTMPSLQKLTVAGEGIFPYKYRDESTYLVVQSAIESFLSASGHQLRQLHITFGVEFEPDLFKKILQLCPRLERLIMDPSTFLLQHWTDSDDLFHPHLRYIDLVYPPYFEDRYRPSELCLSKKKPPSLECIRRFCNLPSWAHTWLDDYPPNPETEVGKFKIEVFQTQINFEEGLYVWVDQEEDQDDRVDEEEIDADSDSDYIFTTSDEDPGSSEEDGFSEDGSSEKGDSSKEESGQTFNFDMTVAPSL